MLVAPVQSAEVVEARAVDSEPLAAELARKLNDAQNPRELAAVGAQIKSANITDEERAYLRDLYSDIQKAMRKPAEQPAEEPSREPGQD